MFYLSNILRLFHEHMMKMMVFSVLSILTWSIFMSPDLALKITNVQVTQENYYYFNALINKDIAQEKIERKLNHLPGVQKMIFKDQSILEKKFKSFIKNTKLEMPDGLREVKSYGLRIIMDLNLEKRNMNLLRDYLIKLTGESNISVGPIKKRYVDNALTDKENSSLQKHSHDILAYSLVLIWTLFGFYLKKDFQKNEYIVERFQRKKHSAFYTFIILTFILLLFSIIPIASFYEISYFRLVGIVLMITFVASAFYQTKTAVSLR